VSSSIGMPIRMKLAWLDSCTAALLLLTLPYAAGAYCVEPSTSAAEPFVPYVAKYSFSTQIGVVAEATFNLKKQGEYWRFSSHARPKGMASLLLNEEIAETSTVDIQPDGIRPLSYTYKRGDLDDDDVQTLQIKYNWQQKTADISGYKGKKQIPLQADIFDTMSVQLALTQDIKQGCTHARYTVFDEDKPEEQVFEQTGTENIQTPLGKYATVKIRRRHGKRETISWFAPKLNYIPVRIHQLKNGSLSSELNLISAEFNPR
jgi:hypothetical protein